MRKRKLILGIFLVFFVASSLIGDDATYYISKIKTLMYQNKFKDAKKEILSLKKIPIPLNEKKKILIFGEKEILYFLSKGDTVRSIELLETFKNVFPEEWRLYNIAVKVYIKSFSLKKIFQYVFLSQYYFYKENGSLLLFNILKSIIIALWLTLVFFTFYYSIKFSAPFLADINILAEGEDRSTLMKIFVFFIFLLLPAFTLIGIFYFPFILMALVYPYLKIQERKITNILIASFIIAFLASIILSGFENSYNYNTYALVKKINSGYYLKKDFDEALQLWKKRKDPLIGAVLLKRYYLDGYIVEAKKIAEELPSSGKYFEYKNFMLGNIYYKLGLFSEAENSYKKVLANDPSSEATNYNVAVLLNRLNEFDKADNFMKVSRDFAKKHKLNFDKLYSIAYYPKDSVFNLIKFEKPERLLINPFLFGILIYFILRFVIQFFNNIGRSGRCSICGKVVKSRSITEKVEYCDECFNLFVIKDPMLSETRKIRYEEIESQKQKMFFLYSILSLFIPGFVLLELDRKKLFIVLYFLFTFLTSFFILSSKIGEFSPTGSFPERIFFIFVLSLFYIIISIITFINGREEWL